MNLGEMLLISGGVAVDAAVVSAAGTACPGTMSRRRCAVSAAMFFGGFQFLMPLIGSLIAGRFADRVESYGHVLACGLLTLVGAKMIAEAARRDRERGAETCPEGGFFAPGNMVLPAVATSVDALAVGAGIALVGGSVRVLAVLMGVVTGIGSAASVYAGRKLTEKFGPRRAEIVGGAVIIGIGVKILMEHMNG